MAQRSSLRPTDPSLDLPVETEGGRDDDVAVALAGPPRWDKRLLELRLDWPGGTDDWRWAAERLRVFLLTWDPFEWLARRPAAFATTARRPDGPGLVLYLPYWRAASLAGGELAAVGAVVGQLAESVLSVASEYRGLIAEGGYAWAAEAGTAPGLLSRIPPEPALAPPVLTVVGSGWRDIEVDALEDLAQEAFGPADLDRSPVRFARPGSAPRCPGCRGATLDFPDGLNDAQESLCDVHRVEALEVTNARLAAAQASNPAGWDALVEAGQQLLQPHLPDGLGPRLVAAAAAATVGAVGHRELAAQAELVAEAAKVVKGLPDGDTPLVVRLAPVRAWLAGLPDSLVADGQDALAAAARAGVDALLAAPDGVSETAPPPSPSKPLPFRRQERVGRNAPCPCGSGKKYKFCHG